MVCGLESRTQDGRRSRPGRRGRYRRAGLALLLLGSLAAVVAAPALAGGSFADLAVGGGRRVWFVGGPGVRVLDASSGRTLATPLLRGAAYPLSVTLAGGAAWVASVEDGYVWSMLSRIDEHTGKVRVLWRKERRSVQYVAAGAGSVWALIRAAGRTEVARFDLGGRLTRVWPVPQAGRIAADRSGCWISTTGRLLHINPAGTLHRVLQAPMGDVATGSGAVWLPGARSLLRVDEHSGRTRRIPTGPLRLGGFQHDLAAGDRALYALRQNDASPPSSTLVRLDPRTGRITGRAIVPGIADAVVARPDAIWVATANDQALRFDPQTLRRTLTADIL